MSAPAACIELHHRLSDCAASRSAIPSRGAAATSRSALLHGLRWATPSRRPLRLRRHAIFSRVPPSCSLLARNRANFGATPVKLWRLFPGRRNCSSEIPKEIAEDSKFVPLSNDNSYFGPPALLLIGFAKDETSKVLQFLKDMGGEFLKVIHCTEDMLKLSAWDVMQIEQADLEAVEIAKSLPRMCLLSGLTGEEIMMFIDAFPDSDLEPPVFAALVLNNANRRLEDLIIEIMGDHEMLTRKQPV